MKRLLLLRHAKSSWHDPALTDFERPLNRRGRAAARAIGDYLVRNDLLPDLVLCSAAQRTRETLAFIQDRLADECADTCNLDLFAPIPRSLAPECLCPSRRRVAIFGALE